MIFQLLSHRLLQCSLRLLATCLCHLSMGFKNLSIFLHPLSFMQSLTCLSSFVNFGGISMLIWGVYVITDFGNKKVFSCASTMCRCAHQGSATDKVRRIHVHSTMSRSHIPVCYWTCLGLRGGNIPKGHQSYFIV